MAEGLATADGERIDLGDVDRDFAAAMATPSADDPEHPAPPDVPPVDPDAPYGRKLDGSPKTRPGGRPPKARTTTRAITAGPGKGKDAKAEPQADYATGLKEFLAGVALGLAVLPIPSEDARIRCRVQAHVIKENNEGLAAGLSITAQHNGVVRWAVEKVTQGGGAWVFPAALAIMPFVVQTSMLWKAPVEGDMTEMANKVEEQALKEFKAEMGIQEDEPADANSTP